MTTIDIDKLEAAASKLKAIAHPLRIALINLLESDERLTVTEIYQKLNIEQAAASHHLNILKNHGIVLSKRVGKNRYYSLKIKELNKMLDCINKCEVK